MSDGTFFADDNGSDTSDDIFQPEVDRIDSPKSVGANPRWITIAVTVPSFLKEMLYHFNGNELAILSRSLSELVPIYAKLDMIESDSPPWKDRAAPKPKVHAPKTDRELPYRFTEEEIVNFVELAEQGVSFEEIARNSGRSVLGVKRAVLRHRNRAAVKGSEE